MLRDVLLALAGLPLQAPLLRGSLSLQRAVRQLQQHKHPAAAEAAASLHHAWQQLLGHRGGEATAVAAAGAAQSGVPPPPPPPPPQQQTQAPSGQPAASSPAGQPPAGAELVAVGKNGGGGAAPQAPAPGAGMQQPAVRGFWSLPAAANGPRAAQRPLSADDIRRQQERQRQAAQLEALRRREAAAAARAPPQPAASQQTQQTARTGQVRGTRALRDSPMFKKLRMSIAAVKAGSTIAPSRNSDAVGHASAGAEVAQPAGQADAPAALPAAGDVAPAAAAAVPAPSASHEGSVLQRQESVRSAHAGPTAISTPAEQRQQEWERAAAGDKDAQHETASTYLAQLKATLTQVGRRQARRGARPGRTACQAARQPLGCCRFPLQA